MTVSNKIDRRPFVAALLAQREMPWSFRVSDPNLGLLRRGDSPEYLYSWAAWARGADRARRCTCASRSPRPRVDRRRRDADGHRLARGRERARRKNLSILVLDNESFGETGRQTGLTSDTTDLCAIARGFGIARTMHVTEQEKAGELAAFLFTGDGLVSQSPRSPERRPVEPADQGRGRDRPPVPDRARNRAGVSGSDSDDADDSGYPLRKSTVPGRH